MSNLFEVINFKERCNSFLKLTEFPKYILRYKYDDYYLPIVCFHPNDGVVTYSTTLYYQLIEFLSVAFQSKKKQCGHFDFGGGKSYWHAE